MVQIDAEELRVAEQEDRRLALHIRRRRQWYRNHPLTQQQLAKIAGVSGRQLRSLEQCRNLPATIAALLAIAIALEVALEDLIAPQCIAGLTLAIDKRREQLEDTAPLPDARHDAG